MRVGLWRKLSTEELMNCGVGDDSWDPLDCKEIQPVHPKGDQSWVFIGRTDVEAEIPILWPPHVKSWLIWKEPDAGKDWGQEEKGATEDEMVGWHHQLNGHEFEQYLAFPLLPYVVLSWCLQGTTPRKSGDHGTCGCGSCGPTSQSTAQAMHESGGACISYQETHSSPLRKPHSSHLMTLRNWVPSTALTWLMDFRVEVQNHVGFASTGWKGQKRRRVLPWKTKKSLIFHVSFHPGKLQ